MSAFPLMLARIILDQIVHLLKGATHSLGHEEKGPNTREHTECSEEYICAVARALNQRRRDETNDEVIEPIGTDRDGDTLGSEGGWEDFWNEISDASWRLNKREIWGRGGR